jgi:hypothetical protein
MRVLRDFIERLGLKGWRSGFWTSYRAGTGNTAVSRRLAQERWSRKRYSTFAAESLIEQAIRPQTIAARKTQRPEFDPSAMPKQLPYDDDRL